MLKCCYCCRGRSGQKGKLLLQDPAEASQSQQAQPSDGKYRRKALDDDRRDVPSVTVKPAHPTDVRAQQPVTTAAAASSPVAAAATAATAAVEPRRLPDQTDDASHSRPAAPTKPAVSGSGELHAHSAGSKPAADVEDAKIRQVSVVTLRSEPNSKQQQQQQQEQGQKKMAPKAPPQQQQQQQQQQQAASQESSWVKVREPHQHQHGSTVFQSDENEVTIVDSDYSDYESEEEDQVGELASNGGVAGGFGKRSTATLSIIKPRRHHELLDEDDSNESRRKKAERLSTFLLAREADGELFGWETLPNDAFVLAPEELVTDEEVIVVASKRDSAAVETPAVETAAAGFGPDEDDPAARESLLALDQALAVFELAGGDVDGELRSGDDDFDCDDEIVIVPAAAGSRTSRLI